MRTMHFGPLRLGWILDDTDPVWREFLAGYAAYLDDAPAAATVEAEILDVPVGTPRPRLPNSFIRERRVNGGDFALGDGLVRGCAAGPDGVRCTVHPALLSGTGLRVLEQFFYLLFHHFTLAGTERAAEAPILLHSSGVLDGGRVFAFCGPAGAGKSTAVAHCPARPRLTDECLVWRRDGSGWRVGGTPINPFFADKETGEGPPGGLYLIEHGPRHELSRIPRDEAVPRLTAEVVAPLGLWEVDLGLAMRRALDRALLLYATGVVRRLRFAPDPGFWSLVTDDRSRAGGGTDA